MTHVPRARTDSAASSPGSRGTASWYAPGLSDGLGDRLLMYDNSTTVALELLRIRPDFATRPGFEQALRARVRELQRFQHPAVARARVVDNLGPGEGLALVSNHVAGQRLSEVLHKLDVQRRPRYALALIRQLTPALAALQEFGEGGSHGLLTPDRIIIAKGGRLVLTEAALGGAVSTLKLPAFRLRHDLGLAVPAVAGALPLDARTDVLQLAFVALSLLLGRRLQPDAYPADIPDLMEEYARLRAEGPASAPELRGWLGRALQLESHPFASALDAHDALTEVLDAAAHRRFVAVRASGELAGAFARSMSHNRLHQRLPEAEPRDDAAPSLEPIATWPAAPATADPFASEWDDDGRPREVAPPEPRPLPLPAHVPTSSVPPSRMRPVWRIALAALALLVVGQAAIIGTLMWKSGQTASDTTAAPPTPLLAGTGGIARQPGTGTPGGGSPEVPVVDPTSATATGATTPAETGADGTPPVAAPPPSTPATGDTSAASTPVIPSGLDVTSDPAGARVTVNGQRRGVTPLALPLTPGQYTVQVTDGTTSATRTVTVPSGGRANFFAALAPAGAAAGWVTITSPLELQVSEEGALIGTTSASRIMLPAGRHQLELANAEVGFQTSVTVDVQPGRTATTTVPVPNGQLSVNALPWANVSVDGRNVGSTPIANLEVPLGRHEIVARHPQLGERRQTVTVTLKTPVRIVIDLAKK